MSNLSIHMCYHQRCEYEKKRKENQVYCKSRIILKRAVIFICLKAKSQALERSKSRISNV